MSCLSLSLTPTSQTLLRCSGSLSVREVPSNGTMSQSIMQGQQKKGNSALQ